MILATDVSARAEHVQALHLDCLGDGLDHGLRPELGRREVDLQTVAGQSRCRCRPDGAQLHAFELAQIVREASEALDERIDGVRTGQHDPIEHRDRQAGRPRRAAPKSPGGSMQVIGAYGGFGSPSPELVRRRLCGLFARPCDEDPLAKQWTSIEPPQMLAKPRRRGRRSTPPAGDRS